MKWLAAKRQQIWHMHSSLLELILNSLDLSAHFCSPPGMLIIFKDKTPCRDVVYQTSDERVLRFLTIHFVC